MRTFHTGIERRTRDHVQRISWADSADLVTWTKATVAPLEADPRWYEAPGSGSEFSPWRDPWVFRGDDGAFAGELSDPMPVVWEGDRLVVPDLTPADAAGSR